MGGDEKKRRRHIRTSGAPPEAYRPLFTATCHANARRIKLRDSEKAALFFCRLFSPCAYMYAHACVCVRACAPAASLLFRIKEKKREVAVRSSPPFVRLDFYWKAGKTPRA